MVEVKDLLAKMEIFDEGRSARSEPERILVVGNRASLRRGQQIGVPIRDLVQLAALSSHKSLIVDLTRVGIGSCLARDLGAPVEIAVKLAVKPPARPHVPSKLSTGQISFAGSFATTISGVIGFSDR